MKENQNWQRELDQELTDIQFSSYQRVLDKVNQPQSLKEKWHTFLNKEVSLPVFPATIAMVLFFFIIYSVIPDQQSSELKENIVERAGSFYWKTHWDEVN